MQCYFLWFSRFPFLIQEAGEEVSLHKKVRHWKCMEIQQPQEPQWSLTSAQMQENSGKKKSRKKVFLSGKYLNCSQSQSFVTTYAEHHT